MLVILNKHRTIVEHNHTFPSLQIFFSLDYEIDSDLVAATASKQFFFVAEKAYPQESETMYVWPWWKVHNKLGGVSKLTLRISTSCLLSSSSLGFLSPASPEENEKNRYFRPSFAVHSQIEYATSNSYKLFHKYVQPKVKGQWFSSLRHRWLYLESCKEKFPAVGGKHFCRVSIAFCYTYRFAGNSWQSSRLSETCCVRWVSLFLE